MILLYIPSTSIRGKNIVINIVITKGETLYVNLKMFIFLSDIIELSQYIIFISTPLETNIIYINLFSFMFRKQYLLSKFHYANHNKF